MYRLQNLSMRGFRGFPDPGEDAPFEFTFSDRVTVVHGENGTGKTSLVAALEWLLFGSDITTKKYVHSQLRSQWDLRHREASQMGVRATFSAGEDVLEIGRTDGEIDRLRTSGEDHDASTPREALGIEITDYYTAVHLLQDTVNRILSITPSDRSAMFQRLLGLSEIQDLQDHLKDGRKYQQSADWQSELDELVEKKHERVQGYRETIREILGDVDFRAEDCTGEQAEEWCENLQQSLESFAQQAGVTLHELGPTGNREQREEFLETAADEIDRFHRVHPVQATLEDLQAVQTELPSPDRARRAEETIQSIAEKEMANGERRYGEEDPHELTDEIINEFIDEWQNEQETQDQIWQSAQEEAALIEQAREYLAEVSELKECPVCGTEKSKEDLLDHLESQAEAYGEEAKAAREKSKTLEGWIKEARTDRQEWQEAQEVREEIREEGEAVIDQHESLLESEGIDLPPLEEETVLTHWIQRFNEELEEVETVYRDQVKEKSEQLSEYEDQVARIRKMDRVLKHQETIEETLQFQSVSSYHTADEIIEEQAEDEFRISVLARAIQKLDEELTRTRLQQAQEYTDQLFKTVTDRAYFPRLFVDDDLRIKAENPDGEAVDVRAIHNHGDINSAAVSVFLGMGGRLGATHELGCMILDDPAQSMDDPHKRGLVRALETLSSDRQIILTTHDDEILDAVRSLTVPTRILRFSNWDVESGPTIQVE